MMEKESLKPVEGAAQPGRRRLSLRGELALAAFPTATVLTVLLLVEVLSEQRLLFASLASSAFLIYLDPGHGTNRVGTLVLAQVGAAAVGLAVYTVAGPGYGAAAAAMVVTIFGMIVLDVVHPPAVSTALGFSLRSGEESNVILFALAVLITAALVLIQRAATWVIARYGPHD